MADDFTARMRALAAQSPRSSVPRKAKPAPKPKHEDLDAEQVTLETHSYLSV